MIMIFSATALEVNASASPMLLDRNVKGRTTNFKEDIVSGQKCGTEDIVIWTCER